jgi:AAA ATPase containing von Willebrand factor type A (vWA) domain
VATVILKKLSSKATPLELLEELDELEELEEDELEEDELDEDELDELDELEVLDEVDELDALEEVEELDDDEDAAVPDELDELDELDDELLDELLLELEAGSAGLGSDLESLHAEMMARQTARHAVRLHLKKAERAEPALLRLIRQLMADTPY